MTRSYFDTASTRLDNKLSEARVSRFNAANAPTPLREGLTETALVELHPLSTKPPAGLGRRLMTLWWSLRGVVLQDSGQFAKTLY